MENNIENRPTIRMFLLKILLNIINFLNTKIVHFLLMFNVLYKHCVRNLMIFG
jgi:hypothetical protein